MDQAVQCSPIYGRSRVDVEPDDPTRAVVHDDEDPMGLESKGLTLEDINDPQTILYGAKESRPRGSVGSVRVIVARGSVSRHRQEGQKVLEICSAIFRHPKLGLRRSIPPRVQSVAGKGP